MSIAQRHIINIKQVALSLSLLFVMVAILVHPDRYINSALDALTMYSMRVLPALFPFMLLTGILTNIGCANSVGQMLARPMHAIYRTSSISGYILVMSIVSGYPVGAKLVADAYDRGEIDSDEAKSIISFSSISGPLFMIGTVGTGLLDSPKLGYIILASNILGAFINGLIYRYKKDNNSTFNREFRPLIQKSFEKSPLTSAIETMLMIAGYMMIFYIIADVLVDVGTIKILSRILESMLSFLHLDEEICTGFLLSTIEMTKGIAIMKDSSLLVAKIALISGGIAFGGLSIAMQSMAILSHTKIKVSYYLKTKLTQTIFTIIIAMILSKIFIT